MGLQNKSNHLPLTDGMIEILMECHERELMRQEPLQSSDVKFLKCLMERRMLAPKNIVTSKGKKVMAFYVTELAKNYLGKL